MAKFREKQIVYQRDLVAGSNDFDGEPLSEVITKLAELQKKHGKNAVFEVRVDSDYGCNSGYTTVEFFVHSERPEEPSEYATRRQQWQAFEKAQREQAKGRRQLREANDRKEFERLKKKYDK